MLIKEDIVTASYFCRGGHDNLGAELINLLPDRSVIAHKLLHVSLLRLSKYIYLGGIDGVGCPQAEAKVIEYETNQNIDNFVRINGIKITIIKTVYKLSG